MATDSSSQAKLSLLLDDLLNEEDDLETKSRKIGAIPKDVRIELFRSNPERLEGKIAAILEIQRLYKGYKTRKFNKTRNPNENSKSILKGKKKKVNAAAKPVSKRAKAKLTYYCKIHLKLLQKKTSREDFVKNNTWNIRDTCARYLQRAWRRAVKDGCLLKRREQYRGQPITDSLACSIIQRAWRRHIDIQVYCYYRDLINFRNKGDPSNMLRCINPKEAKLMDAAAGIHIKFRLAGERFPPNIYYKIYTHRPIQDLCANSPKDYTSFPNKMRMARDVNTKTTRVPQPKVQEGWYQRMENNGWRLVSDRLILMDPVTWETSQKPVVEFNCDKLIRKQDVEKRKKTKKIEWMKKMYKNGLLKSKAGDEETRNLIDGATAGMVATIDKHGQDAVQDWEVDELLDWTTSLNFNDYMNGWKEIATSSTSEQVVDDRLQLLASTYDPFELNVSIGPPGSKSVDRETSAARQSHNTPVSGRSARSAFMYL